MQFDAMMQFFRDHPGMSGNKAMKQLRAEGKTFNTTILYEAHRRSKGLQSKCRDNKGVE